MLFRSIGINVYLLIFSMVTNYRLFKGKVLPSDNVLPDSYEEAKKLLKISSVEYISYHACPNYCILYRIEYVDKEICLKCGHNSDDKSKNKGKSRIGPPFKIFRHMPLIPRIQRLFHCKELAMLQGWHASHRSELGVMRIPTYSIAMKHK